MITSMINDLLNFLNFIFVLFLIWTLLKFYLRFRYGFKFKGFRKANYRLPGLRVSTNHSKAEYEFRKFKYEQKMNLKREKYQIKMQMKYGHRSSSKFANLPGYLRVIK